MVNQIIITPEAQEDLDDAYQWYARKTIHALEWHESILTAISTLNQNPERCPIAPEATHGMPGLRQLICGHRRHSYRILFVVLERTVSVVRIVHGARSRF